MDFFESRYYNTNRLALSISGLWPYANLYNRLAYVISYVSVLGAGIILFILKMLRADSTTVMQLCCFRYTVTMTIIILNVCYYIFYTERMKELLEHIKQDWSLFEQCDIEITQPSAEFVRMCNMSIMVLGVPFAAIPMLQVSKRSNIDSHSNETDILELLLPRHMSDVTYDTYVPYVSVILFLSVIVLALDVVAICTLHLSVVQHVCGVFNIAGRRIEMMFSDLGNDIYMYENKVNFKVFRSIMFHVRAVGFLNIVNAFFGPLYMTIMILIILLLSVELFQVTSVYDDFHDFKKYLMSIGNFMCVLLITTLFCYTGQLLMDYNNDTFIKTYSSRWYMAPLNIQKLILIVMSRNVSSPGIMLTKSSIVSLEMLATMIQMSVSYCMVLNSLH